MKHSCDICDRQSLNQIRFEIGEYGDIGGYIYKDKMFCGSQCFYDFIISHSHETLHGIESADIIGLFKIVKGNVEEEIFSTNTEDFLNVGVSTLYKYTTYKSVVQYVENHYKDLSIKEKKEKTVELINFRNKNLIDG